MFLFQLLHYLLIIKQINKIKHKYEINKINNSEISEELKELFKKYITLFDEIKEIKDKLNDKDIKSKDIAKEYQELIEQFNKYNEIKDKINNCIDETSEKIKSDCEINK